MQQKRKWITLAVSIAYTVVAMFIMLYAVNKRGGIIENEHQDKASVNPVEQEIKQREAYERIIVVDPCGSGESNSKDEKQAQEITLDIARRLEEKILADNTIKVYYTRTDDTVMSEEQKLKLISETEADFYVGIALNESSDASVYGVETVYNGTYFIPYFGNTELADCMERNVTKQALGRANGLTQAGEEDIILQKTKIPAVVLKAGYLSNNKEAELLNNESYREQIAEGVFLAVQEAYEKMENESE